MNEPLNRFTLSLRLSDIQSHALNGNLKIKNTVASLNWSEISQTCKRYLKSGNNSLQ